mmetsp:Transcript_20119/g.37817  ORF Transcript_20119/g.37817 Transcript_20119/m.37817 type:complete len:244 (+) Transcript_20119:356-1087(+)
MMLLLLSPGATAGLRGDVVAQLPCRRMQVNFLLLVAFFSSPPLTALVQGPARTLLLLFVPPHHVVLGLVDQQDHLGKNRDESASADEQRSSDDVVAKLEAKLVEGFRERVIREFLRLLLRFVFQIVELERDLRYEFYGRGQAGGVVKLRKARSAIGPLDKGDRLVAYTVEFEEGNAQKHRHAYLAQEEDKGHPQQTGGQYRCAVAALVVEGAAFCSVPSAGPLIEPVGYDDAVQDEDDGIDHR